MIEALDLDENKVEPIKLTPNYSEPSEAQKKYEYNIQHAAGLEPSANFGGVRQQLAQQHKEEEEAELLAFGTDQLMEGADPLLVSEAVKNYDRVYNVSDIDSSLEVEAGRNNIQKTLEDNETTRVNALTDIQDYNEEDFAAKDLLVERFRQSAQAYANGDNKFGSFANLFLKIQNPFFGLVPKKYQAQAVGMMQNAIPFWTQYQVADIGEHEGTELSALTTGERQKAEFMSHYVNDTPQQFSEFLQSLQDSMDAADPIVINTVMENLFGAIDTSNDFFQIVDTVDLAGSGVGLIKSLKGGLKSSAVYDKVIGNISKAEDTVVKAVDDVADTATIVEDAVTTSATQPFQSQGLMSLSSRVADKVKDVLTDKEMMKRLDSASQFAKMSEEEQAVARDVIKTNISKEIDTINDSAIDIQVVSVDPWDYLGESRTRITIGGGLDGKSGMTKEAAQKLADNLDLLPDQYSILKKDGQGFYLDIDRPFKEGELIEIGADKELDEILSKPNKFLDYFSQPVERTFAGRAQLTTKQHEKSLTSLRLRQGLETFLRKDAVDAIKGMSKHQRKVFKQVYKLAQKGTGSWLSDDIIKALGGDENCIKAWRSFRKINDFEYIVNDLKVHKDLIARGYFLLNDKDIARYVNVTEKNFDRMLFKDIENYADLKKKLDKGFKVVELHRTEVTNKSLNFTHAVIDPTSNTIKELPRFITPYQEGGRRAYTWGTAFVKIGTKLKSGGRTVNGFAKTVVAGIDKAKLQKYADEVNTLIDIYNSGADEVRMNKMISNANFKQINVTDVASMKKLIKSEENPKGLFDPDYKAQVLEDGDRYAYNNGLQEIYDGTENLRDSLDELVRLRESTFDGRGYVLDSLNGEKAKLINPFEIWDTTIRKASYTATTADLHKWYQREFRRNFQNLVEGGNRMSDAELILAPLSKTSDAKRLHAAKAFQQHYLRLCNAKTGLDRSIENCMEAIARYLGDNKLIGGTRQDWETLAKTDPIAFARTMEAYHVLAFNPAQLITQPMDLLSTFLAHPINSTRSLTISPFALTGLWMKRHGITVFDTWAKATGKVLGVDMKRLVQFLDEFGTLESVGQTDVALSKSFRESARMSGSRAWKGIKKAAMSPYTLAQGTVNMVTDIAAFLDKGGKDFVEIAAHSDNLTRNMTKATQSAFQYGQKLGISKLMSQWYGYLTHSMEAIMGGKHLTKRERFAMAASTLIFTGGLSNLGTEYAANKYRDLIVNPDSIKKIMDYFGFKDYQDTVEGMCWGLMHAIGKEFDINYDNTLGVEQVIERFVSTLGLSDDDRRSRFVDFIPAVSAFRGLGAMFNTAREFVKPETNVMDMTTLCTKIAANPDWPVGPRKLCQGLVMYNTGLYYNSKQEEVAYRDIDERGKWATLTTLGLKPYESFIDNVAYLDNKHRERIVKEAIEEVRDAVDLVKAYTAGNMEDPMKAETERDRLMQNVDEIRNGYIETFLQTYGDVTANGFAIETGNKLWAEKEAGEYFEKKLEKYDPAFYQYLGYKYKQNISEEQ